MSHYTYRAEWSPDSDEYIGSCIELPYLTRRAATAHEAIAEIVNATDEHVASLCASGEDVPTPLTERSYSGKFVVRTSPALHGRLAIEAAEQRVSINQWVVQKLADRERGRGLGTFAWD